MGSYEEGYEDGLEEGRKQGGGGGCGLLIVLAILYLLFGRDIGKYEGSTSEEWFNEYDYQLERYIEFRECVETFDNFDTTKQLRYGSVFQYCE